MKIILFFLIFLSTVFACVYAPHLNVIEHNDALAPSLLADNCITPSNSTYDNPIVCAEMNLLTIYPSTDERISSDVDTRVLWRYAYKAVDKELSITAGCCTSHYYKIFNGVSVLANLTAHFKNQIYYSSIINQNPASIPISQNILNMSEWDNLTIILNGTILFHYILNKDIHTPIYDENNSCSCASNYLTEPFNITRSIKSNLTYTVEGGSPIYFLSKPILREQWTKNSLLEEFVFSNRKFQCIRFFIGDQQLGIANLYSFSIINNSFGVWRVVSQSVSNSTNLTLQEITQRTIPAQFEIENKSFLYTYVFNTTYNSSGLKRFSLNITDHFNANYTDIFEIANRLLTYDNSTAENRSTNITDLNIYRPSALHSETRVSFIVANIGMIGAFILILFLSRK